ncbi:glycoside hydrolase superfamily [Bisporella sp. PMI_857]|nr:glycoside hydrolase superfamily [Bisporella sp. PMI_857]
MLLSSILACACATVASGATFALGQKFQIILNSIPDLSAGPLTPDAAVFDVDAIDTPATTIAGLKAAGRIVICYFSAGTYEAWRADAPNFQASDLGKTLPEWPDEKWARIGSTNVRSIMTNRIIMASQKGCDAIDPDNTDGWQNDNGLSLQQSDAVNYIKFLSTTAAKYGMKTGLKNSIGIIPDVLGVVDFAINEQCSVMIECDRYGPFINAGKPVFHIEYPATVPNVSAADRTGVCTKDGKEQMSTVLKYLLLDGWVQYCDGSIAETHTTAGIPNPHYSSRPTTSKTTSTSKSTSKPTTTVRTTTRPTTSTASTSKPTTTSIPGGGSGCKSKHWDQCGGNDWKGCTVCEAGFTCKAVSPPWYYQCL